MCFACREIVEQLNVHPPSYPSYNFYIGLHKVNGVWTNLNNEVPSDGDIHWDTSLNEPATYDTVAVMNSYEGYPHDLLTSGAWSRTFRTYNTYPLCEYHCI